MVFMDIQICAYRTAKFVIINIMQILVCCSVKILLFNLPFGVTHLGSHLPLAATFLEFLEPTYRANEPVLRGHMQQIFVGGLYDLQLSILFNSISVISE